MARRRLQGLADAGASPPSSRSSPRRRVAPADGSGECLGAVGPDGAADAAAAKGDGAAVADAGPDGRPEPRPRCSAAANGSGGAGTGDGSGRVGRRRPRSHGSDVARGWHRRPPPRAAAGRRRRRRRRRACRAAAAAARPRPAAPGAGPAAPASQPPPHGFAPAAAPHAAALGGGAAPAPVEAFATGEAVPTSEAVPQRLTPHRSPMKAGKAVTMSGDVGRRVVGVGRRSPALCPQRQCVGGASRCRRMRSLASGATRRRPRARVGRRRGDLCRVNT